MLAGTFFSLLIAWFMVVAMLQYLRAVMRVGRFSWALNFALSFESGRQG
jgi:hypothetical protein